MTSRSCHWCGGDTTFLFTCPGLCLSCGDRMQSADKLELITSLAKAVGAVKAAEADRDALREKLRVCTEALGKLAKATECFGHWADGLGFKYPLTEDEQDYLRECTTDAREALERVGGRIEK